MKLIHWLFVVAFGLAGAMSMFQMKKQAPIHNITQVFSKYTDVSKLPKNYQLHHVNDDILPHLRRSMLLGFLGGLVYGFFMMRYLRWAIRKGKVTKQATE
ncbi:hypothetical protein BKI52_14125 [marine bacterium AO1-C]|nr:hypothetical protein BKI52_14125 [marine bacterium AO1-C]